MDYQTHQIIQLDDVQRILLDVIDEFQATISRLEEKLDAIQTKQQVRINAPIIRCIIDIGRLLKEFPKTKTYEPKKQHGKIEDPKMASFFVRMDNALFSIKSKLTVIRDYIKQCKSLGNALALTLILNDVKQILDVAENPDTANLPSSPTTEAMTKPFSNDPNSKESEHSDLDENDNNTHQDPEEAMNILLKQRRRTLSNSQETPPPFVIDLNKKEESNSSSDSKQTLQVPSWTTATPRRTSMTLTTQKEKLKDYIEDMLLFDNSLRKLIADPKGNKLFMEFLKKNHCEENLEFWQQAHEFRKIPASEKASLTKKFNEIYSTFVTADSPKEVNLTSNVKKALKEAFDTKHITPSTLEEAQKGIFVLMENDPYRRFTLTDVYKQYQADLSQETKNNPPRKEVIEFLTDLATEGNE